MNNRTNQPMPDLTLRQRGVMFRRARNWLLLLTATGALLRFCLLGVKSLWPVEAFSVYVARLPWHEFLRAIWWGEANMAL